MNMSVTVQSQKYQFFPEYTVAAERFIIKTHSFSVAKHRQGPLDPIVVGNLPTAERLKSLRDYLRYAIVACKTGTFFDL